MAGILHENRNVLLENSIPSHREEDDYGGYYICSDKGENFDTKDSEFMNGYDTVVEDNDYNNFLGDDWEWDQWTTIGDYDGVPGPPMNYHYNERCVLTQRFSEISDTLIQCVFKCTSVICEFFQIIACQ